MDHECYYYKHYFLVPVQGSRSKKQNTIILDCTLTGEKIIGEYMEVLIIYLQYKVKEL